MLIPSIILFDKLKLYLVIFYKVLNIMNRHCSYTYIILYTVEMNTAGVMVIFRQHIKATISLLCLIVSDYDVPSMWAEFQD